jgi:hypothetical protein
MQEQNTSNAELNGRNEQEGIKEEMQRERAENPGEYSKTDDEMSVGDSERNYGQVSGTTFGDQSNTAKFSNIGTKNQAMKGGGGSSSNLNEQDRASGAGGTGYSSYLNEAQQELISGTNGKDSNGQLDSKPFDAMQGNQNT